MNKMNKKGFTLIEMLVVIAIIAVLVSIIVPVVSNSTVKAKCATNAANLRSVKAEIVIALLNDATIPGLTVGETSVEGTPTGVSFEDFESAPEGAPATFKADDGFKVAGNPATGDITVTYDGLTVNQWAALAK